MVVIIAGGRNIKNKRCLKRAIKNSGFKITRVVCGLARGIDLRGKRWAVKRNIPVSDFPAEWDEYGKRAGHLRNLEMAVFASEYKPDAGLILIWDGLSKGSANMLKQARIRGLKVHQEICE